MTRILALDFGKRHIGLALSDESHMIAQALGKIDLRYDEDPLWLNALEQLVSQHEVSELVVGLPLHMKGHEGTQAEWSRMMAQKASEKTSLPIHFVDERMTTLMAERMLVGAGVKRAKRKEVIDGLSAQIILQNFLDQRART